MDEDTNEKEQTTKSTTMAKEWRINDSYFNDYDDDVDIKSGAVNIIMYERLSKLRGSFFVFWKNLI
jgi:hypothetical protein